MDPEFQDSTMPGFEPDTWPDLGLFRGSFSGSPASLAKVQGTVLTEPHQDTQSVTRGVQRLEQLQTRSRDEKALVGNPKLSSLQQDYLHEESTIPVYDDRGMDAIAVDDSREDDIEYASNTKQEELLGGIFLKKHIPAKDSFPALHDHLSALWENRQLLASAMNLALEDDDVSHYGIYRDHFGIYRINLTL